MRLAVLDVGLVSGRTSLRRLGLVVLGFAVLTKQSFAFAPVVGALMLVGHPAVRGTIAWRTRRWWARTAGDLACLASLPVLYVGVVALAGGLDDMVGQFRGARPVWFETMFRVWQDPVVRRSLLLLLGSAALLLLLARWRSLVPASFARGATAVAAVAVAATTLRVLYDGHLLFSSRYAVVLLWGLLGMSVVEWSRSGSLPLRPLLVAALAWMSALSWGYDSPALLGGSLVLGIVWLARPYLTFDLVPGRVVTAVAAVGVVGMAAVFVTAERHHTTYRDRPRAELALGLGGVSPELRGIRTNEVHYAYITQIRSCLDQHPARRVAVLPDNAFVYPALDLDNPFPMDWLFTDELVGDAPQRVLAAAASLDEEGDYLVLFQQTPGTSDLYAYTALEPAIYQSLHGLKVTCGPFVGVWSPGQV